MVDKLQVDNPANKHMHYGVYNPVGILTPPDKLPVVVVYSPIDGQRQFNTMEKDVYAAQQSATKLKTYKFPTILKIIGGVLIVSAGILFRKDISKFVKKLFNR